MLNSSPELPSPFRRKLLHPENGAGRNASACPTCNFSLRKLILSSAGSAPAAAARRSIVDRLEDRRAAPAPGRPTGGGYGQLLDSFEGLHDPTCDEKRDLGSALEFALHDSLLPSAR